MGWDVAGMLESDYDTDSVWIYCLWEATEGDE